MSEFKKNHSDDDLTPILEQLDVMKKQLNHLTNQLKSIQKSYLKKKKVTKVVSGFLKPVSLSPELSDLIGTKPDELVARSVVNKKINEYIKANNLQVQDSKQNFVLDSKMSNVFNLPIGSQVHYFKMQSYLKNHYPKPSIQVC